MVKDVVGKIVFNKKVGNSIYILSLEAEDLEEIYPGQFAMLRIEDGYDPFLRRPMSLFKKVGNKYYFLYQVVGRGTEILSRKREGEEISILLPPWELFSQIERKGKCSYYRRRSWNSSFKFSCEFLQGSS